jgi:hypothetical protein
MASQNTQQAREQSIAEHFSGLSQETAGLVREELRLLRDELTEQGKRLGAGAGLLAAAGVLGSGAFGALTASLIAALGGRHRGRGAFIVAVLYGGGAAALALAARERMREVAAEGVNAVGRDVQAAAAGAREGV